MESIGRPTSLRQVKILAALLIGPTGEGIPDPKVHLGQDLYSENHGMGEKIVKKLIDEDQERNGVFKILSHSSIFLNVFRIFNGRFNSNFTNYGQIIVQWVEFNIKQTLCLYILRNFDFCVQNGRHDVIKLIFFVKSEKNRVFVWIFIRQTHRHIDTQKLKVNKLKVKLI